MRSPPDLRMPPDARVRAGYGYAPGVVPHLNDWVYQLDHPKVRRGEVQLPYGLNLHATEHLQRLNHVGGYAAAALEEAFLDHWVRRTQYLDQVDLQHYVATHQAFETLWPYEALDWVLELIGDVPDASDDPTWIVGERGRSYWVRKFDQLPDARLPREILRTVLRRAKDLLRGTNEHMYQNQIKNIAMKGCPLWLVDLHPELLEQHDLSLPADPERHYDRVDPVTLLAIYTPINSGVTFNQDVFVALVTIDTRPVEDETGGWVDDELGVADGCPAMQIPHALRDNPEMEVRDAMKLYLSAGGVKNRRIVLEFNKFTTYYAETFGLRHAPVKGGATRYLMGQERAHLHINASPHNKHDYLEIRIEFATEASKAFYGRLVTFIGAFWMHCRSRFGEDLLIDLAKSELIDATQIETWGQWAYGEVLKRYPNLTA